MAFIVSTWQVQLAVSSLSLVDSEDEETEPVEGYDSDGCYHSELKMKKVQKPAAKPSGRKGKKTVTFLIVRQSAPPGCRAQKSDDAAVGSSSDPRSTGVVQLEPNEEAQLTTILRRRSNVSTEPTPTSPRKRGSNINKPKGSGTAEPTADEPNARKALKLTPETRLMVEAGWEEAQKRWRPVGTLVRIVSRRCHGASRSVSNPQLPIRSKAQKLLLLNSPRS